MNRFSAQTLLVLGIMTMALPCVGGLSPHNIAVVVNELSAESEAVGRYCCSNAGIPLSNLIEIRTLTDNAVRPDDYATLAKHSEQARQPDWRQTQMIRHMTRSQALVLCYGVPFRINFPRIVKQFGRLLAYSPAES